jgi:hypothetical protein
VAVSLEEVKTMAVRAIKPKPKNRRGRGKHDPMRIQTKEDAEALMAEIENDPNATPMAKELVALLRERDKSGEPYLTIEQIQAELGRD